MPASADAATQATALSWVNEFVLLANETMVPFTADMLVSILPSLSSKTSSAWHAPARATGWTRLANVGSVAGAASCARYPVIRAIAQETDVNMMKVVIETRGSLDYARLRTVLIFQVHARVCSCGRVRSVHGLTDPRLAADALRAARGVHSC